MDGRNLTKSRWSSLDDKLCKSYGATSVKFSHYVNGIYKNFCNYLFIYGHNYLYILSCYISQFILKFASYGRSMNCPNCTINNTIV